MSADTLCRPRAPLRCWQYRKGASGDIPRWALQFLMGQADGRVEFVWPDNGSQTELGDGDWLVLLDNRDEANTICTVFDVAEFQRLFENVASEDLGG